MKHPCLKCSHLRIYRFHCKNAISKLTLNRILYNINIRNTTCQQSAKAPSSPPHQIRRMLSLTEIPLTLPIILTQTPYTSPRPLGLTTKPPSTLEQREDYPVKHPTSGKEYWSKNTSDLWGHIFQHQAPDRQQTQWTSTLHYQSTRTTTTQTPTVIPSPATSSFRCSRQSCSRQGYWQSRYDTRC